MQQIINEKISVITVYDRQKGLTIPKKIRWQDRNYDIVRLTYHHKINEGRTICHIFHVTDGNVDFRLKFDSNSLIWVLEEVYTE